MLVPSGGHTRRYQEVPIYIENYLRFQGREGLAQQYIKSISTKHPILYTLTRNTNARLMAAIDVANNCPELGAGVCYRYGEGYYSDL